HPLRIKPLGNAFTASSNLRDTSTGNIALLPDELIIQLLSYLDAKSLLALGSTSKGLYAFCRWDELWKDLFVNSSPRQRFTWHGTWRTTYLNRPPTSLPPAIPCPNLYSDVLYRPFYCSQISLSKYTTSIPPNNLIPRLTNLSTNDFNQSWASMPFILTSPVKSWLGYQAWTIDSLLQKYSSITFRAEAVDWPLQTYGQYMSNNSDESPLYLFDKHFAEKTSMGEEYTIPPLFTEDFFSVLGKDRPDRKWLILGPAGSGSSFHKDPNATSAWNAVVEGEKYWIMFPNNINPPGVFVSEDQSEVTSPLSIAEWFEGFHKEARRVKGVKEGICRRGEVLYVPSGWWHLVVNLSTALAITENFVPKKHLPRVLSFLRDQPQSVSGFDCEKVKDPYRLFVQRMEEGYPDILEEALKELRMEKKVRGKWDEL
ncbi:Clavaminate synthase-like protein, partial [Terfezia boudieri ATCC MYA-4762]